MTQAQRIRGVLAPVVTPFNKDLSPDPERFVAQCKWMLTQNCGLAVFGTNSEANSLSANERVALLDALLAADVDPARMMPGTGCCALTDTVRLTEHAVKAGCAGVLMLPPFYYKDVSEDGLYRNFSEVIERVGDSRLRIYLYHIPPVAVVGIKPGLVERLMKQYPTVIAGMKDSSGDWNNTKMMLDAFAKSGFDVFVGSESFLLANMKNGGAGCISATANVNPAAIDRLFREWRGADAEAQQQALDLVRKTVGQYVMIPSLKAVVAHFTNDPDWATVRPPLTDLTAAQAKNVIDGLKKLEFDMPGISQAQAKAA
ncbi:MAG: dihydrodipicolinate synthetase [Betaproteobacteria bacterium SG8_41]|nr:MAG: dihydrodipicolinate synthetase [Betaproteobacteria bacterium SG8_41]